MKQFLITVAGVLVGLVVFVIVAPLVMLTLLVAAASDKPAAPGSMVLELDLREPLTDQRRQSALAALGAGENVLDIVVKLDSAARDRRVKGVFVRAATDGFSPAHAQEIRDALAAFRRSGKFVVAHIQNEGLRMSMAGYSAVAGADELWLQGVSEFMPMGLSVEEPFLGDTLSRFRVQAQFEAREEFKSFADIFTQRGFTPANREQLQSVLTSLYDSMIATIAADRELTPEAARAAIEATPITGEQAVQAHLVDRLGQPESAAQSARDRAGENTELVDFSAYMPTPQHGPKTIAVVLGEGEILGGTGEDSFFGDEQLMLGDDVAEALLDASEDKDVAAIIFRVSSPGGSVVASDQILAALRTARARGKPVIVSMGDVAASGGYYVSAEANEIVANPTTITGSIGVVGGKFVFGPALEHYLSMHSDSLVVGSPLVTMFSADTPFTPAGRTAFSGFIDRAYQEFMTRVATGRRLTVAQVREIARGRIWTGAQAKERRLVDHLGGFSTALARARAHARIGVNERVTLKFYPEQKSPFEELQQLFGASAESARAAVVLGTILGDDRVEALLRATQEDRARMRARMEDVEVR